MRIGYKLSIARAHAAFMETFGLGRSVSLGVLLVVVLATALAVFWFVYSAPSNTITITSGPEGSVFQRNAGRYSKILARNGVKLKILPSEGSLENLKRLLNPSFRVDIGFVQGGVANGMNIDKLVSLGSISYQPLLVFYRGARPVDLLSQLDGKRLAIGPEGSGTRSLALALLAANGIEPGVPTELVDLEADDAAKALTEGRVDAVFLMGDFASPQIMRNLLLTQGIHLLDFIQADAYTRRITYLNKLVLPKGSVDLGKNMPSHDVHLIAPTVELVARANLHPALCDLLVETATEVHGAAGLLRRQGEFPAPLEHEFRISPDASRFYKSGKGFLYRSLPFRFANLVNRILVVFVPLIVLLIPVLRIIPGLYQWRMKLRIYRWYRALLMLEQGLVADVTPEKHDELLSRLGRIEEAVNTMKVPASFAEQFYVLRVHINFVRDRLEKSTPAH